MKRKEINGITVFYDEPDLFSIINAVYLIQFIESGRFYYGYSKNPSDRINEHCTHINSVDNSDRLLNMALNEEKKIKFSIISTYNTPEEANEYEKRLIHKEADRIYEKLGGFGEYQTVVNTSMLNIELYTNVPY